MLANIGSSRVYAWPRQIMAPKQKRRQVSLEDVALEPLLKKPSSAIGKTIKLPGEYWGTTLHLILIDSCQ